MGNRAALPLAAAAVIGVGLALVAPGLAGGASARQRGAPQSPPAVRSTSRAAAPATGWMRGIRGVAPSLAGVGAPGRRLRACRRAGCRCPTRPPSRCEPRRRSAPLTATTWWRTSHPWAVRALPSPAVANGSEADGRTAVHPGAAPGATPSLGAGGVITGASAPALQQASATADRGGGPARPLPDAALRRGGAERPRTVARWHGMCLATRQSRRPRRLGDRPRRPGSGGSGGVAGRHERRCFRHRPAARGAQPVTV